MLKYQSEIHTLLTMLTQLPKPNFENRLPVIIFLLRDQSLEFVNSSPFCAATPIMAHLDLPNFETDRCTKLCAVQGFASLRLELHSDKQEETSFYFLKSFFCLVVLGTL